MTSSSVRSFSTRNPSRLQRRTAGGLGLLSLAVAGLVTATSAAAATTNYVVRGVLKAVKPDEHQLVVAHETIPNFMEAMTMPFIVKDASLFTNLAIGRQITFQLHVTETESWIDHIKQAAASSFPSSSLTASAGDGHSSREQTQAAAPAPTHNPLRDFKFTNELGRPVRLSDFRGQAVALTFFFTRCPIPEFCPRLSRNFEAVQRKLGAMPNAPTNWHLLSVTFDPARDTPEVLRAYGKTYQYDPAHWSFLTGPQNKIAELARLCDVQFKPDTGFFNHNFRTLIIDASNRLQTVFPTSGDLSDALVQELLRAAGATNRTAASATGYVRSEPHK